MKRKDIKNGDVLWCGRSKYARSERVRVVSTKPHRFEYRTRKYVETENGANILVDFLREDSDEVTRREPVNLVQLVGPYEEVKARKAAEEYMAREASELERASKNEANKRADKLFYQAIGDGTIESKFPSLKYHYYQGCFDISLDDMERLVQLAVKGASNG